MGSGGRCGWCSMAGFTRPTNMVTLPQEWAHSTFRRAVARSLYPSDWAGGTEAAAETGEYSCTDRHSVGLAGFTRPTVWQLGPG